MFYSTTDADFMKELQRHAKAVAINGGGIIWLNHNEYEQAKRIAKTADVFKWKWFRLYYAGVQIRRETLL